MRYYAAVGDGGLVRWGDSRATIGVYAKSDDGAMIGEAYGVGYRDGDVTLWRLVVDGAELPGRFVVRDRRFVQFG